MWKVCDIQLDKLLCQTNKLKQPILLTLVTLKIDGGFSGTNKLKYNKNYNKMLTQGIKSKCISNQNQKEILLNL